MGDLNYGTLMSGLMIGMIGSGVFLYGKKTGDVRCLAGGAGLCVFPYFVGSVILMWAIALAGMAGLWWAVRQG